MDYSGTIMQGLNTNRGRICHPSGSISCDMKWEVWSRPVSFRVLAIMISPNTDIIGLFNCTIHGRVRGCVSVGSSHMAHENGDISHSSSYITDES